MIGHSDSIAERFFRKHDLSFLSAIVFIALIIVFFSLQTAISAPVAPAVQTDPADNNFLNQATLHGRITANGGEDCDQRGFDWRPQSDTDWQSWIESSGPYGNGSFSHAITGLSAGTVHAFRAKAHNSAGWSYGNILTFRVIAKPTLQTAPATDITTNSATLNTKIIDNGGADLSSLSFRYRKPGSYWIDLFQSGPFGPVNEFSDGFEDGTLDPFQSKSDPPWTVGGSEFYTGNYCARSGTILDGQSSSLSLKVKVTNGESNMRFAYRVSSEKESDYLIFLVDDVEQSRWSGEVGWQEFSSTISTGDHILEWRYQKDNNGNRDGSDAAWVDDVRISSPGLYGMSATSLDAGATYEFIVIGTNYAGQTTGDQLQFTTSTAAPSMSTGDAGSITWSGATLNGSIAAVNTPTACDERGFDWRKQGDTAWQSWTESPGPYGTGAYARAISGLASNTTYEVRAKAHNSVDWGYGEIKVFTTGVGPPSVQADPATNITPNSATLNGTIVDTGGLICDWRGFKYRRQGTNYWLGPEEEHGSWGPVCPVSFSLDVTGLDPGATYEFYCYAHNACGFTTSINLTFFTKAAPTVATEAASDITAGSATLNGNVTDIGGVNCDEREFEWRRQGDADWLSWTESPGPYGTGSFSHAITGLSPYVTYEFKAEAHNSAGWGSGSTLTFATPALPPTVTTDPATTIGQSSGTLNGSITGTGGEPCDRFDFNWRLSGETDWNSWQQQGPFGVASYSYFIHPLDADATIEFRFGARNSAGWTYGEIRTFTTLHPAIVQTDPATDITTTSAVLHGEILDTGGIDSELRGFYIRKVGQDWGAQEEYGTFPMGPFSMTVSGLDPGCDYEFKARAYTLYTSEPGYGEILTFRTAVPSAVRTDPATNIDSASADIHGLILDTGGENCDQHGFEWRKQGETDWQSWAESGDYSKDLLFSDGFEDGTLPPFGTGGLGYGPWTVVSPGAAGSAYCARSAAVSDNQKTYIRGYTNQAKRVSFNFKVSSEEGYDSLIFKIDDNQEVARWSGEQGWQNVTFDLVPGQHTFDWWYQKDGSVSQGSDCAWIDDVRIETPFDLHLSGLDPGATYEFRARAHNSTGWSYGDTRTLTTGGAAALDTDAATNVQSDEATLNGDVTNQGADAGDERGFDYRPAGQDSWQSWTESPGPYSAGQFGHGLSGLQAGTGYSFRAKTHNSAGWSYGKTLTFETKAAPTMETNAATSVDHQSAVLNGVIASTGGVACTERGFEWRKQGDTAWNQSWTESPGPYTSDRIPLSGDFEDGTLGTFATYSNVSDFNLIWRPEATESGANTGAYCARSPVIPDAKIPSGGVILSEMILGFSPYINVPGDNYRIRFARKVSSEQDHDLLMFFIYTNNNPEPPFPLWPDPTGIWSGEVPWETVSYAVPPGNNAFYWWYQKDGGHGGADAAWVDDVVIESTIPFSHKIDGLDMGTTYEFRSTAQNEFAEGYGPIQTFKTAESSATQTDPAGSVTSSSARLNGRITNTGGVACTKRGFEWRKQGETVWHSWTEPGSFGAEQFGHTLSGLKPNTKYEFLAKAYNSVGWSHGGIKTFKTLTVPPKPKPPPPPPPNYPNLSSTWYLAEGSTAYGFDCYITIENPNDTAVMAQVTYMTGSGPVTAPDVSLPAMSQATVNPREVLGNKDFSTRVHCVPEEKAIAVDRTMTWTGPGAASPEAHSSIGVTSPSKTWYLPEGSSKWGFECWLLIQNPNFGDATCSVTYMIEGQGPKTVSKTIPANSRKSFNIADDIGQADASIKVEGNIPVIPERAMYRNNRREGHDSIGTTSPAKDFYLAEGTSAYGFTTYVLIQNPNAEATDVTVTYMTPTGPKPQAAFTMDANSRKTIRVNDVEGMESTDFSTQVHGTKPIIAERAMYWDNGIGEACHDSVGMDKAHTSFYLPDGQTSEGRETYTLVQNPNSSPVTVQISYLTPTGAGNVVFTDSIPANSRKTYNMADKGIGGRAAIMVTSKTKDKKIMVERAMYWNSRGAGTDTIGGFSD